MSLNCLLCNTDFNTNDYLKQMTTYAMCPVCFEKSKETARIVKSQEKPRKSKPKSAASLLAKALRIKGVAITAKQIKQANGDTRKRNILRVKTPKGKKNI